MNTPSIHLTQCRAGVIYIVDYIHIYKIHDIAPYFCDKDSFDDVLSKLSFTQAIASMYSKFQTDDSRKCVVCGLVNRLEVTKTATAKKRKTWWRRQMKFKLQNTASLLFAPPLRIHCSLLINIED